MRLGFQTNVVIRFLASGVHSDCKVICGPHTFNVHKIILCSGSAFFRAALEPGTFGVSLSTSRKELLLTGDRRVSPAKSSSELSANVLQLLATMTTQTITKTPATILNSSK